MSGAIRTLRTQKWWSSKMPPLLGVAGLAILRSQISAPDAYARIVAALFGSGIAAAGFAYVINDIFDIENDRVAGKENRMAALAPATRWVLAAGLLAACFLPTLWVDYGGLALILLGVECAGLAAYSVPPIRLKERRALGAAGDAAIAHLLPTLFLVATFTHPTAGISRGDAPWIVALAIWSAATGMKNILWHQIVDREADSASGLATLATTVDVDTVRAWIYKRCYPVEAGAFLAVVVTSLGVAPGLAVALAVALARDGLRVVLGWRYVFDASCEAARGPHLPLIDNRFYETWFPLVVAIHAAMLHTAYWGLPAILLLAFGPNFHRELSESWTAVLASIALIPASWRGWRLEVHGDAAATMARRPRRGWRVEIRVPSDAVWHVKVSWSPQRLRRGHLYAVRMSLRADEERTLTLCATRGRAPWDALGLSRELRVGGRQCDIAQQFVALDDDSRAGIHVLLGGQRPSVEMRDFSLQSLGPIGAAGRDPAHGDTQ